MFNGLMSPSDSELATQTLGEESSYRFSSFSASDAVTLGLSIRKRFRASHRHSKGKGLVLSIQTIAGHTLFACTVGDLGNLTGTADVSLDSWTCLEGMIAVVRRTGHSSFYVEKGMSAMGKTPKQLGMQSEIRVHGGAFPIWLENAHCCPIAVVACYSGSSIDDHNLVVGTVRDYLSKLARNSNDTPAPSIPIPTVPAPLGRDSSVRFDLDISLREGETPLTLITISRNGTQSQETTSYDDPSLRMIITMIRPLRGFSGSKHKMSMLKLVVNDTIYCSGSRSDDDI